MREIEVKILNINPKEIEGKLIALNAIKIKHEAQINMIYDTPEGFLEKIFSGYSRIRITENLSTGDKQITYTVKKNLNASLSRQSIEHEVIINDSQEMEMILSDLGYVLKHKGHKERVSYRYDNILFEIDTWDKDTYPRPYLEIEVEKEEDIEKALVILELDRTQLSTKSIAELRLEI